ncbi:hypothetical protein JL720_14613 [Aureococcus anophagefferens]|nr:hypothetical protein JL720_14613 [Aureococcus anophagefferens]
MVKALKGDYDAAHLRTGDTFEALYPEEARTSRDRIEEVVASARRARRPLFLMAREAPPGWRVATGASSAPGDYRWLAAEKGVVEQLVAANARHFYGTGKSSMTEHVLRLCATRPPWSVLAGARRTPAARRHVVVRRGARRAATASGRALPRAPAAAVQLLSGVKVGGEDLAQDPPPLLQARDRRRGVARGLRRAARAMEEPFQLPPARASGGATIESLASGGVQVVGCAGLGAPVVLSAEEAALFRALFLVADGDGDGLLSPGESRAFLRRCLASEPAVARCHAAGRDGGGKTRRRARRAGTSPAASARWPRPASTSRATTPCRSSPTACASAGGSIVKVMSPQLVGEGLQQFTQYAVRTRSTCAHYGRSEMRVLRRFSDFEWCRERLRRSRPGVVVPPLLSPKRWANNTSHDFVRERMESLTLPRTASSHPKLRAPTARRASRAPRRRRHGAKLLPSAERCAAEAVVRAKRAAAYEACRAGRYLALAGGAVDGAPGDEAEPAGRRHAGAPPPGAKVEAVGTCAQDHVDHEVAEFLEQLRYQKALMEAARDAAGDRGDTQRASDLERAIQRLAARARAASTAPSASTAKGEQGRRGRPLELRGALLEYAATNLGFVKRNAATWHQLKDAMQPTDVEVKAPPRR